MPIKVSKIQMLQKAVHLFYALKYTELIQNK